MIPLDIVSLRLATKKGNIEWRKHVLQRLAELNIQQKDVIETLLKGELIENYSEDKPFASGLFFEKVKGKPLHVVAAYDGRNDIVYVITVYEPSSHYFQKDFKTRKK